VDYGVCEQLIKIGRQWKQCRNWVNCGQSVTHCHEHEHIRATSSDGAQPNLTQPSAAQPSSAQRSPAQPSSALRGPAHPSPIRKKRRSNQGQRSDTGRNHARNAGSPRSDWGRKHKRPAAGLERGRRGGQQQEPEVLQLSACPQFVVPISSELVCIPKEVHASGEGPPTLRLSRRGVVIINHLTGQCSECERSEHTAFRSPPHQQPQHLFH
jgi:hypothetical protein